ncbi:MAG: chorismate synthase [Candidatus Thermoplasmatota archaeon]|nr:chorismate synthase [Candidatus Thermoplasmatota archaeon]MEC8681110.1 chorismate synthase [Candidatus Thermoplasmatota archaeon]MEE2973981.1 chorismate synthase [Candidatus Thermoplasmatota archaeon]
MGLGEALRVTLRGSSHGPFVGALVEGLPEGLNVDEERVQAAMKLRKTGGTYSSKRKEADRVEWRTGVVNGITTGEPIEVHIANQDARSSDYSFLPNHPRPGHQDMVMLKRTKGEADLRGGGTSSARMTAPLVAVAAVVRPWLEEHGILVEAHLGAIGNVEAASIENCPPRWANETCEALRCRDPQAAAAMAELVESTKKQRNSIGSRVDLTVQGLPLGLGEPWFDGLEPALARAMMAIPAARGVEFGHGFAVQTMHGSEHNSPWGGSADEPVLLGEQPDGALAGLSTGAPVKLRVAFKPPSSIPQEQHTLNLSTNQQEPLLVKGRHDPVLGPRAVAVVEAMALLVVGDLMVRGGFHDA